MIYKRFGRIISVLCVILIAFWIFMNPYTDVYSLNQMSFLLTDINNFFLKIGLGYKFSFFDISLFVRFTEYMIFGIMITVIIKVYSKNFYKNICIPLFFGLAVALVEIYFKVLTGSDIGVKEIIISFVDFCIGVVFYIIFTKMNFSKKREYKYKARIYDGRR